jgi:uncharacterized protein
VIAFDTSALVKLVIAETESDALVHWLAARHEQVWVASDLCRVEFVRAVARAEPRAVGTARELLDGLDLVPLSPGLLGEAAALSPASMRSLDAIHLATAATLGPDLAAFVVYDHRLAEAGGRMALPVVQPA